MNLVELGNLAATGWRAKLADAAAPRLKRVTPLEHDQARAVVGAALYLLSLYYVVQTALRAARQMRR